MNSIFISIMELLAGCGVFMAGMNMMSSSLQQGTGKSMKKLFNRISNNRFAGIGIGAAVTALIQSSAATTVMAIGFVNAGVMTLVQATAIIMGADIGTTVTGLLVSLSAFDVSLYLSLLAFVGVMMMFIKNNTVKNIGGVLCGLGLLFIGLDMVSSAFQDSTIKGFFSDLIASIDFPLLLILIGAVFTALIQSSSAATSLVIIMVGQGVIPVSNALFIVLGSNIGTCITPIIASIGASTNGKRTAFIHLIIKVIGVAIFTAPIWIFADSVVKVLQQLFDTPQMQIALFHTGFNILTVLILSPFEKQIAKLAEIAIKDKTELAKAGHKLKYVDARLLKTPSIALMQVKKELLYMASLAKINLEHAILIMQNGEDKDIEKEIVENEDILDFTNNTIAKYLVQLSPLVPVSEEKTIGSYFHVINDIERIGDHAENFLEISQELRERELGFSDDALSELMKMHNNIMQMFSIAVDVFMSNDASALPELTNLEAEIDKLKSYLFSQHFMRLSTGDCKVELSAYFYSTVSGMERVADHLINIGYSVLNPTGDDNEKK